MKKIKSVSSANGIKGMLLDSFDGNYYFRITKENGKHKDYLLKHSDLSVTITDEDAVFYELEDGSMLLDHSPETLGLVNNKTEGQEK